MSFRTTTNQRKPLTCAILQRNGFQPQGIIEGKEVYVGNHESGRIGLFFVNANERQRFQHSRLMRTQPHIIVERLEEIQNPMKVYLNKVYKR